MLISWQLLLYWVLYDVTKCGAKVHTVLRVALPIESAGINIQLPNVLALLSIIQAGIYCGHCVCISVHAGVDTFLGELLPAQVRSSAFLCSTMYCLLTKKECLDAVVVIR